MKILAAKYFQVLTENLSYYTLYIDIFFKYKKISPEKKRDIVSASFFYKEKHLKLLIYFFLFLLL